MSTDQKSEEKINQDISLRNNNIDEEQNEISKDLPAYQNDPFGDEEFSDVKYKVMSWW